MVLHRCKSEFYMIQRVPVIKHEASYKSNVVLIYVDLPILSQRTEAEELDIRHLLQGVWAVSIPSSEKPDVRNDSTV
jgi:hypothetical protein